MADNRNRRKYWEIDRILNCPVVGTCLSLAEQKKVLKKSGISIAGLSDYEIHYCLVQSGRNEGPISLRIQRMLDSKYKQKIAELGDCDEDTFLTHWRKGLRRGEIDDLIWVGFTNRNLSPEVVERMFEDYHMHTHGQGAIIRRQLQQVDSQQKQNQRLSDRLKQTRAQKQQVVEALHVTEKERDMLQQQIEVLERKNQSLQDRPHWQHLQQANNAMENKTGKLEHKLQAQSEALAFSNTENDRLMAIVEEQAKIIQHLETEFEWLTRETDDELACQNCLRRDLCSFRVLVVGGLTTLRPHYQNLVESGGGEFKYYDSLTGTSERSLLPMINWADLILCPIDFNSHRACLSVKKLCKKMQKPYKMLPHSSMSAISRILESVSTDLSE